MYLGNNNVGGICDEKKNLQDFHPSSGARLNIFKPEIGPTWKMAASRLLEAIVHKWRKIVAAESIKAVDKEIRKRYNQSRAFAQVLI